MKTLSFNKCLILLDNSVEHKINFHSEDDFSIVLNIRNEEYRFIHRKGLNLFSSNNRVFREIMPFSYQVYIEEMKEYLPKEIEIFKEK